MLRVGRLQSKCRGCNTVFIGQGNYCRICVSKELDKKEEPIPSIPIGKKVGLVMTTLNQWNYTRSAIQSLYENTEYPTDIIVLDGASIDGTPDKVRSRFPHVTVLELDRPYWVSYAWNRALEYCLDNDYDYIGILNNDMLFQKNWLTHTLSCFADPNVGYASPIQVDDTGSIIHMGKNRLGYYDITLMWHGAQRVPLTWIPGACILLRKDAALDVGQFDESFFFGNDEVDYCIRLWLNGWKVVSTSHTKVVHFISKTISEHGGKQGRRTRELKDEYGVDYINPRERFYQKWDTDTLEIIYETFRPEQKTVKGLSERMIKIWNPTL